METPNEPAVDLAEEPARATSLDSSSNEVARAFSRHASLTKSADTLERRCDRLIGKAGYLVMLSRLTKARSELLQSENELKR